MIGEVEVMTLVVLDNVGHRWHSIFVERTSVNCLSCVIDQTSVDESQVVVGHVLHHFLSFRVSDVSKTKEFCAAEVILESHDVLVELVLVGCEVSLIAVFRISPFFTTPGDESDCPLGS